MIKYKYNAIKPVDSRTFGIVTNSFGELRNYFLGKRKFNRAYNKWKFKNRKRQGVQKWYTKKRKI